MYSYQLTQTIGRRRCSKDKWDLNRRSLTSKVTALPLSHNSCCATNNCTNYEFSTIHISWPSFLSFSEAFPYGVKFTLFFTFPSDDRSRDTLTQILKCKNFELIMLLMLAIRATKLSLGKMGKMRPSYLGFNGLEKQWLFHRNRYKWL